MIAERLGPHVIMNGHLLAASEARISPLGEGFLFGRGLFETIKVLGGRPVFFQDHADRLGRSAGALGLPILSSAKELRRRCDQLIAANKLGEGSLKIVVFDDAGSSGELIMTRAGLYSLELYLRGFRLKTVRVGRVAAGVRGMKTLSYLENVTAKRAAQASGFDEALFFDPAGTVLEGATSNVFAVKDDVALTPPLGSGILPGIARANVMRILGQGRVREGTLLLSELLEAEEMFVTNALLGVMPVACIDQSTYDLNRHPFTKALMEKYRRAERMAV
jgi:branched-subunit amino acid aminotransferase/4-amino-4-deoxychorismate lyase